ncbi:MAG: hypothetical protein QGG50_07420 [Methanopyri archaeon]|jgi:hypothetical protein|nr:hypothetical protein [Methanopyri archaeon]
MTAPTVVFDASHDEYFSISKRKDPSYRLLARQLVAGGMGVREAGELDDGFAGDVLVVAVPRRVFQPAESAAVQEFVKNGGGLVLVGMGGGLHQSSQVLNALAFRFGMVFGEELLHHNPDRMDVPLRKDQVHAAHAVLLRHPVLEGVGTVRVRFGCSVTSVGNSPVWVGDEPLEEQTLAALEAAHYYPVLALQEEGKGRVVALGDASLLDSRYVRGSARLAGNIMTWAAGGTP